MPNADARVIAQSPKLAALVCFVSHAEMCLVTVTDEPQNNVRVCGFASTGRYADHVDISASCSHL